NLYHDIVTAFTNRLSSGHYPAYINRLTRQVFRCCEWRLGVQAAWLSPAERIGELAPAPLLLLTGTRDSHATPDEARRLFERRRGPAELLLIEGAGHDDVCESGGLFYRHSILDFLQRRLFGVRSAA